MNIIKKILSSFDNTTEGYSARKLSAFVGILVAIYSTYKFVDTTTIISALMVWLTFSLLCLGIITAEQILRFKGQNEATKDKEPTINNDQSKL